MGVLKPPFWILREELLSLETGDPIYPWCWPLTEKTFAFPEGTFPSQGITKLPRDSPDIAAICDTDEKYDQLCAFFEEVNNVRHRDENRLSVLLSSVPEDNNLRFEGVRLYKKYWERVVTRAKFIQKLDQAMLENQCMPWQYFRGQGLPYPFPKKGNGHGRQKDKASLLYANEAPVRVRDCVCSAGGCNVIIDLFGEECRGSLDSPHYKAKALMTGFFAQAWDRAQKRYSYTEKRQNALMRDLEEEWNKIETMKDTETDSSKLKALNTVIKKTSRFCAAARVLADESNLALAQAKEDELRGILTHLKSCGQSVLLGRTSKIKDLLKSLISIDTIEELEREYAESFKQDGTDLPDVEGREDMKWFDDCGDIGVTELSNMSLAQVKQLLGLPDHEPDGPFPFFNKVVHDAGRWPELIPNFDEWDSIKDIAKLERAMLRPLRPRWHQYVGLAACVKRFFQGKNVLLADGVGVGKTLQCFMMMSFLRHLRVSQMRTEPNEQNLPAIADMAVPRRNPMKWGYRPPEGTVLPSGQFLVVVPNPLMNQWHDQARITLQKGAWNVIWYPTSPTERKEFWEGVWPEYAHVDHSVVLLAPHSAIRKEASEAFGASQRLRSLDPEKGPVAYISRTGGPDPLVNTVFAQRWALVFWDEAQWLRTEGHLSRAAHALRVRSASTILCSATPLHNGERDLVSLGLILGVGDSHTLLDLEKKLKRDLAAIRKEHGKPDLEEKRLTTHLVLTGKLEPPEPHSREHKIETARVKCVSRMRKLFTDVVVRRSDKSLDNEGKPIHGLPDLSKHYVYLDMGEEERTKFNGIAKKTADRIERERSTNNLETKAFYAEYRIAVGFADLPEPEKGIRPPGPPKWTTRNQWLKCRSAKWAMITKLVLALLLAEDENHLPCTDKNGSVKFPKIGGSLGESEDPEVTLESELRGWELEYTKHLSDGELIEPISDWPLCKKGRSKIIIYVEYVLTLEYLIRGLELSGVQCVTAAGSKVRCNAHAWSQTEALDAFKDPDSNYRVLIMTSIGNAGLNLHEARFMIFADMVWSGQTEAQIIGRMYRQPNQQLCRVYFPIVRDTTDELLTRTGKSKIHLLDVFYNDRDTGPAVFETDDSSDEDGLQKPRKQRQRRKPRNSEKPEKEAAERRSRQSRKSNTKSTASKPKLTEDIQSSDSEAQAPPLENARKRAKNATTEEGQDKATPLMGGSESATADKAKSITPKITPKPRGSQGSRIDPVPICAGPAAEVDDTIQVELTSMASAKLQLESSPGKMGVGNSLPTVMKDAGCSGTDNTSSREGDRDNSGALRPQDRDVTGQSANETPQSPGSEIGNPSTELSVVIASRAMAEVDSRPEGSDQRLLGLGAPTATQSCYPAPASYRGHDDGGDDIGYDFGGSDFGNDPQYREKEYMDRDGGSPLQEAKKRRINVPDGGPGGHKRRPQERTPSTGIIPGHIRALKRQAEANARRSGYAPLNRRKGKARET